MKRPEVVAAQGGQGWPDAGFAKDYPVLVEFLTTDAYEDGSGRERSTLTIKAQDGMVLGVLNDVDMRRSLYMVAEGVAKVLKSLEKAASAPGADWRPWGGSTKKKRS